jgi:hypothetical protein
MAISRPLMIGLLASIIASAVVLTMPSDDPQNDTDLVAPRKPVASRGMDQSTDLAPPASGSGKDSRLPESRITESRSKPTQAMSPLLEDLGPVGSDASSITKRRMIAMQGDLFRDPPKPPPPVVQAPPPAPPPAPRFVLIGRVNDGGKLQVIAQDGQAVSTLGLGQSLNGFKLETIDDTGAVFTSAAGVKQRLEIGRVAGAAPNPTAQVN